MSILIKGGEMPKDIEMLVVFSNGTVHKCLPGIREYLEKGTAVPVPPHGRLIDANALMKILSKVIDINASIEQRNEATDQERRCLWWFEQQIGIAPTIIEAEEGE